MESFRVIMYVLISIVMVIFYGIPPITTGIKEWKEGYYPKWFCIYSVFTGVVMCLLCPIIVIVLQCGG